MKHIRSALIGAVLLAVAVVSFFAMRAEREQIADHILIHMIDVGQGDCMVIETAAGNIMIDSGTDLCESRLRAYLHSHGLTSFEYLILSHPHDDHIGSADMVLREFHVKTLISADTVSDEPIWHNVMRALDDTDGETAWIVPRIGDVFWVDRVRLEILSVPPTENEGGNDDSLIVRVDMEQCSMLLMGDAEAKAEAALLDTVPHERLHVTCLKVGHHGSSGSTTDALLHAVRPSLALISAGAENAFSHPHEETLARLRAVGADIYRTDLQGTLVFLCDGKTIVPWSPIP